MHMTAFGIFDLHLQAENLAFVESGYRADIQLITSNEMEQLHPATDFSLFPYPLFLHIQKIGSDTTLLQSNSRENDIALSD